MKTVFHIDNTIDVTVHLGRGSRWDEEFMNTIGLVVYGGTPLAPPLSMTYLNLGDVIKHPKAGRIRRDPLRGCLNQAKRGEKRDT